MYSKRIRSNTPNLNYLRCVRSCSFYIFQIASILLKFRLTCNIDSSRSRKISISSKQYDRSVIADYIRNIRTVIPIFRRVRPVSRLTINGAPISAWKISYALSPRLRRSSNWKEFHGSLRRPTTTRHSNPQPLFYFASARPPASLSLYLPWKVRLRRRGTSEIIFSKDFGGTGSKDWKEAASTPAGRTVGVRPTTTLARGTSADHPDSDDGHHFSSSSTFPLRNQSRSLNYSTGTLASEYSNRWIGDWLWSF